MQVPSPSPASGPLAADPHRSKVQKHGVKYGDLHFIWRAMEICI
jgi:hypothetical protein